ncbi:MAG: hypothetical protein ABJB61_11405 [bacterium]
MRIICDHCDRPISGTVKQLAGNLNLHPDCMAELSKETKHKPTMVSLLGQESSVSALECSAAPSVSMEME